MLAAQSIHMTGIRFVSLVVLAAASGCAVGNPPPPAYPQQMAWTGPPGGAIDEGYGYQSPEGGGSYEGSYPPDADSAEPSADPADPNYAFGDVSDVEIEATLEASGEWIEDEDYGRVWLPYTTVVGGEFTPYDSSGDWVYTDYGWSFQSDFDWGWLAFHFGNWMMFDDDRWGWVPDHTWGPSWCEWRHDGNDVVGWRPQAPSPLRDHRTGGSGGSGGWGPSSGGHATIRDHRTHGSHKDPSWRFAHASELSKRARSFQVATADGLRSTRPVARPPAGQLGGRAASLMGGRLRGRGWAETHPTHTLGTSGTRPWRGGELGLSTAGGRPWMQPRGTWNGAVRGGARTQPQGARNEWRGDGQTQPQGARNEWRGNSRDWRPTQRDWRPQRPTIDDGRGRTFGTRPDAGGGSRMWPQTGDAYGTDSRGSRPGDAGTSSPQWGDRGSPSRPSFDGGSRPGGDSRPSGDTGSRAYGDRGSPSGRPSFDSGSRGSPSRPSFDNGSRGDRGSPSGRPSFGSSSGGSRPSFDGGSRGSPSGPRPSFDGGSRGSSGGSRPSPSFNGGSSGGGRSAPSSSSSSGGSRGSSSSSSSSSGSSRSSGGGGRHR